MMRMLCLRSVLLVGLCHCCLLFGAATAEAGASTRPPNIVFILMDDMGWRDVGFMGNAFVETPHIDRLAKNGLVFTQSYSGAPNCAPTRACLMSGQYPPRHGIYTVVDPRQPPGSPWHRLLAAESLSELNPRVVTIAEALQSGGYQTGFFGMWNLGRGRSGPVTPGGQGFQTVVFPENLGFAKDAYATERGEYLSDRLTDEVLKFMDAAREQPFFVYLADHAVHAPFQPKPALLEHFERKGSAGKDRRDDPAYAATIAAVDQNVGRIMERLAKLGLADETIVVFTSDNGGTPQYTAPLRGSKGELYEGGIRVPLVVSWPGLKSAGTRCDFPVQTIDWYPTLLELAGLSPPAGQELDGVSLVPILRGLPRLSRTQLFWHFPCYVGKATPASAIRDGDFKLIEFFENGGRRELYDLRNDPHEEHDLAASRPEKAQSLYGSLQAWQRATSAALPRGDNPDFDPRAERPRGNRPAEGGGRRGNGKKGKPK
ncbi:MAG: sulfatase [Planctomycetes bacterium]|nr:sulfatase [Planctomycetota bacterium]